MRVTSAFKHLLRLPGVHVRAVGFEPGRVVVSVVLRRRRLRCPLCQFSTPWRYDRRDVDSVWRHLDLGSWELEVRARLRRLSCPRHGVRTEGVPFARHGSGFTADFEALAAWLATRMDQTAVRRLLRVAWVSVGAICERVSAAELDPARLDQLFEIGVDEVSWRKHHRYLTLVSDHRRGKVVWGAEGRDSATVDGFFNELGPVRAARLQAVSMDMSAGYEKSVQAAAPQAVVCFDPFHVVALGTRALDQVRRSTWNELRALDGTRARMFKGARWALLKNPEDLSDEQAAQLRKFRRRGGALWRAYTLKEALRAIFAGDLTPEETAELLDRLCAKAQRSALAPFVKLARTLRRHREGILAAVRLGLSNARHEALNNKVRLNIRRAHGFHSAKAALALVML
ncbi:MAG: ISL3 family transposase, partial [Thermoleophilaceae bacterium]